MRGRKRFALGDDGRGLEKNVDELAAWRGTKHVDDLPSRHQVEKTPEVRADAGIDEPHLGGLVRGDAAIIVKRDGIGGRSLSVRIGAAVSTHHDPLEAGVEAARIAASPLEGGPADLTLVFASGSHLAAPEAMLVVRRSGGKDDTPALLRDHPAPDRRIRTLHTLAAEWKQRMASKRSAPAPAG